MLTFEDEITSITKFWSTKRTQRS